MVDELATRLSTFADKAEKQGLPVKMLRDVGREYTVKYDSPSHVRPALSNLDLEPAVLDAMDNLSPSLPLGEAAAVQTIYHEATHAWT